MYDSWKDCAVDAQLDADSFKRDADKLRSENQRLREQNNKLTYWLNQAKRDSYDNKMRVIFATQKLRKEHLTTNPVVVDEDEAECSQCNCRLERDWDYCPICGHYIDWAALEVPEDDRDNWYEEEGNRFLQAAVFDPIRERWGD